MQRLAPALGLICAGTGSSLAQSPSASLESSGRDTGGRDHHRVPVGLGHQDDCGGCGAPDDRWLSIAETFEFLPAEE
jgi:hypothetical protein